MEMAWWPYLSSIVWGVREQWGGHGRKANEREANGREAHGGEAHGGEAKEVEAHGGEANGGEAHEAAMFRCSNDRNPRIIQKI